MEYDLKITGGTIVDGTGTPRFAGDIGVRDGKIVALGEAPDSAVKTIDANGRIVAPGFVDIHTHYDLQVLWDRMLTVSPWHGVTTVVMGNCGFGVAPTRAADRELILKTLERVEGMSLEALTTGIGNGWSFETFPEYLDAIEQRGVAINVAVLFGHTPVRLYVMGREATERAATEREIAAMSAIAREAIAAGAIGFATSVSALHVGFEGRPVPSRLAEAAEIRAIASAVRDAPRGITQISAAGEPDFDLLRSLAEATDSNVCWTALLSRASGDHERHLERSQRLAKDGLPIFPQISCRPLVLEFHFAEPFPFERLEMFRPVSQADFPGKKRLYADPSFRDRLKSELEQPNEQRGPVLAMRSAWAQTAVSFSPTDPACEQIAVAELARKRGVHPIDLALDLSLADDLATRFLIPIANTDEEAVEKLLQAPGAVLGLSDAGAHASQLCDACYSTHLLGHWVRERQSVSLEAAIRMLTAWPAEVYGIADRGQLAIGMAADIVMFDPDTVGAGPLRRVHDLPAAQERLVSDAYGIDAVIVNGTVIRRGNEDRLSPGDAMPGRLLRGGAAAA